MTPDQQRLADRLQLTPEQLAIAATTTGVKSLLAKAVEQHGASVVFGRHPSGKGVLTFSGALALAFPKAGKVKK